MKIPISSDQRKALMLSLAKGYFNIEIFPELTNRMPNTVAWFHFIAGLTGDDSPAVTPLDRQAKIAALKALKNGYFNLVDILPVIEVEEKRERFLELMQAASVIDADER